MTSVPVPADRPSSLPRLRLAAFLVALSVASVASGEHAYVVDLDDQSLTVVDTAAGSVVTAVPAGGTPWGVAVAAERVYLAVPGAGRVTVLDTVAGTSSNLLTGGTPTGVGLDPAAGRLYVTDPTAGTVAAYDAVSGAPLASASVAGRPMAVAADGSRVYVAAYSGHTLEVLDGTTLVSLASIPVGRFPTDVVVAETLNRAFVAGLFDEVVTVVDTTTLAPLANLPVGGGPGSLAYSAPRNEVYATLLGAAADESGVTVIDAVSESVIASFATGRANPADVLPSATGDRLYVDHLGDSRLVVLDPATGAQLGSIDLGTGHALLAGFTEGAPAPVAAIPSLGGFGLALLAALLAAAAWRLLGRRRAVAALALAAALAAGPVAAQSLEILDGDFDAWTSQIEPPGAPGQQQAEQRPATGNPGNFWFMVHNGAFNQPIDVSHRYAGGGAVYDPATRGAITEIDYSWDRRLAVLDGPTAVLEAPAVFQGSEVFVAGQLAFATLGIWEPVALPGLTAADFSRLGGGGSPDFSASGPPLSFGFVRSTPGGFAEHHLDNFRACAHSASDGGALCGGGSGPGELRFADDTLVHLLGTPTAIGVRRVGGSAGAVSVEVDGELPTGLPCSLQWADGEAGTKSCVFNHPPGLDRLIEYRLVLQSPTGGAGLGDPNIALLYAAPDDASWVFLLVLLGLLMSGFDAWGLALLAAGALLALAWRRRRDRDLPARAAVAPVVGARR